MPGNSQVATAERDGSDVWLLANIAPVTALSWKSALPGGDATLTAQLQLPTSRRHSALRPGRIARVWRGGGEAWLGTLAEPVPGDGGWQVTANGIGTDGNSFVADWDDRVPGSYGPNSLIDRAANRGMRWTRLRDLNATPGLDLTQPFDSCSKTITDALNQFCDGGTLTWAVNRRRRDLRIFPLSQARPTRLLVTPDPPGRTLAGHYNRLWARYQATADNTGAAGSTATYLNAYADEPRSVRRYGPLEGYGDYTNAGVATAGQASGWARGVLAAYHATSYTDSFAVIPGQVRTIGGTAVDLGCEQAGEVYQVIGASQGWGGEDPLRQIRFLGGEYEYDDVAQAATITPYQMARSSLSDLLTAMTPAAPATPASS